MDYLIEISVSCPHCGETFPLMADTSQGSYETIEDCSVCCRPIHFTVNCSPGNVFQVTIGED